MDFDPDGVGILYTYKYSSIALAHESAQLRAPTMQWLGLRSKDLLFLDDVVDGMGVLRLSLRDRRKARQLLKKEELDEGGEEADCRRDLQVMLLLNVKAEIQILSNLEGGLGRWLEKELIAQYLAGR